MDRKEILESGILLDYLIGDLNDSKHHEIELALAKDAELNAHYKELERQFENIAFENSITPSTDIKAKLIQSIAKKDSNSTRLKFNSFGRIAASIAILFAIGTGFLWNELSDLKHTVVELNNQNKELNSKVDELNSTVASTQKWFDAINKPEVEKYVLKGNALSPNSTIISYVNRSDQTVILNTSFLEEIDSEHDYQLWADVDGVMIDMGIIDTSSAMLAMNFIANSESLNITIEPKGGSKHPTVSQLISNVYL